MDYTILVGGAAGQGIDTVVHLLERTIKRSGYYVFTYKNFMSSQMDMFTTMEKDFVKNYNVGSVIQEDFKAKEIENTPGEENFKLKNLKLEGEHFSDNLNEIKSFFVQGE